MKDVKINISATGFPSQFVSDAEKSSDSFGKYKRMGTTTPKMLFLRDKKICTILYSSAKSANLYQ